MSLANNKSPINILEMNARLRALALSPIKDNYLSKDYLVSNVTNRHSMHVKHRMSCFSPEKKEEKEKPTKNVEKSSMMELIDYQKKCFAKYCDLLNKFYPDLNKENKNIKPKKLKLSRQISCDELPLVPKPFLRNPRKISETLRVKRLNSISNQSSTSNEESEKEKDKKFKSPRKFSCLDSYVSPLKDNKSNIFLRKNRYNFTIIKGGLIRYDNSIFRGKSMKDISDLNELPIIC